MIVFVCGLVGSGKTTLANALAEDLGAFHYNLDDIKARIYPLDPDYDRNIREGTPFSDATRMRVYQEAIDAFPALAQQHHIVIVDEVFHKEALRKLVFDAGEESFKQKLVVWVQSPESVVEVRLPQRKNHIVKDAMAMRRSMSKVFDPITDCDVVFQNDLPMAESAAKFVGIMRDRIFVRPDPLLQEVSSLPADKAIATHRL